MGPCSALRKKPRLACFSEISHADDFRSADGKDILHSLAFWWIAPCSDKMVDRRFPYGSRLPCLLHQLVKDCARAGPSRAATAPNAAAANAGVESNEAFLYSRWPMAPQQKITSGYGSLAAPFRHTNLRTQACSTSTRLRNSAPPIITPTILVPSQVSLRRCAAFALSESRGRPLSAASHEAPDSSPPSKSEKKRHTQNIKVQKLIGSKKSPVRRANHSRASCR